MSLDGPRVATVGELFWDHVFTGPDWRYAATSGGGAGANTAYELGPVAVALGFHGADRWGVLATEQLRARGVDTRLEATSGSTRQLFEHVDESAGRGVISARCPVCGQRYLGSRDARAIDAIDWQLLPESVSWALFDGLTAKRVRAARAAERAGLKTALNLNLIGGLRYVAAVQVAAWLGGFELVLLAQSVAESLRRRLQLEELEDLAALIGLRALVISRLPDDVLLCSGHESFRIAVPAGGDAVDALGAEDVLLANMLDEASRGGRHADPNWLELTHRAIDDLGPVLQAPGARGHAPPHSDLGAEPALGQRLAALERQWSQDEHCPVCLRARTQPLERPASTRPRSGARRNVGMLLSRVLPASERAVPLAACRDVLNEKGTAYAIGSGGSYSAAVFISELLNARSGLFCQPARPLDYVRLGKQTDVVIALSYSGATDDIAAALRHARSIGARRLVLVTAATESSLRENLDEQGGDVFISYGGSELRRPESGFVSFMGVVAPVALWTAAATDLGALVGLAKQFDRLGDEQEDEVAAGLADAIREGASLAILGGGWAWPAMLDIESKGVESDLADVQLHETKDFSHGRFVSVLNAGTVSRCVLMLRTAAPRSYERHLLGVLRAELDQRLGPFEMESRMSGLEGGLELLVRAQILVERVGRLLQRDISRPEYISAGGLSLYRWRSSD